ncbi:3'-5' exonuclease [Alteromonas sp. 14N.309.X.WAT.G.H12]|uniref:3'-5' exonuclease n=1 Tax=Alteromonas sp. 14N.309.X.WAT.G.H12 TaxID=3120824 RepID=UPI002FD26B55
MSLTERIVNHPGGVINIAGVPGAGKTTEVINLARHESSKRILYISFGKQNTRSAKRRMPSNVICTSFHGFAYNKMNIAKSRVVPSLNLSQHCASLSAIGVEMRSPVLLESLSLLNYYFCMSGLPLNQAHLLFSEPTFPNVNKKDLALVLQAFMQWWRACWDSGSQLPITHDMYFKAYALSCSPIEYDYLVIDECQDLNSAMFEMTIRLRTLSPKMKTVRLGDPCQQLFGYRGSSEQFANAGFDLTLDHTHRFGTALCDLVNDFMGYQLVPHYTPIKASSNHTEIKPSPSFETLVEQARKGKKQTLIAKYNMSLWHILKALSFENVKCAILGGVDLKEIQFLKHLYQLYLTGRPGSQGRLRGITYEKYKTQASFNQDNAATLACRFVENIGDNGHHTFRKIEGNLTSPAKADVMLTTVHQAKGLEFRDLIMLDDFPMARSGKHFISLPREEAYLTYTAMTRAINSLSLPKSWGSYL